MKFARFPSGKNLNVTRHLRGRGGEENKGTACNHGDEKPPLQLGRARRTLMAAWISRTFFLAKTCMWLDTSVFQNETRKAKRKSNKELQTFYTIKTFEEGLHKMKAWPSRRPPSAPARSPPHLSELIKENAGFLSTLRERRCDLLCAE